MDKIIGFIFNNFGKLWLIWAAICLGASGTLFYFIIKLLAKLSAG